MPIDFETDLGSLDIIADLTGSGREMLYAFLRNCDGMRNKWSPTETQTWHGIHFVRRDITRMTMERKWSDKDRKIVTTIDFANGSKWRRGSLRVPNTSIPDTIMNAIKGRLIEELVEGTPVRGYTITHAVHDKAGASRTLRIRSTAEKLGPIPYVAPRGR